MNYPTKVANIPTRRNISRNQQNNNMNLLLSKVDAIPSVLKCWGLPSLVYEHTVSLVGWEAIPSTGKMPEVYQALF
jgi:hypothetical protein